MKILSINFSNLNSLKGDFCIQLDSGTLHEAGIFAICGPTGSGKSTILDAITLALFGKAARYDDGTNVQNMMSRGTWESKASITFETQKKVYTSTWMLKRAHKKADGKFQGVKRELSDGSGTILYTKRNEIDEFISTESGLDYKRFLRSVLLAQGQFKEFLDANAKARGELLEKITGTEIYSDLGKLCYFLTKEKNLEIYKLKQQVEHLKLLEDSQIQELNSEKSSLNTKIKEIKSELEALKKAQNKYKILVEFNQNNQLISKKELELKPLLDIQASTVEKLKKFKQTHEFQHSLFTLDHIQKRLTECKNSIIKVDIELPKAQDLLNNLNHSLKSFYLKELDQLNLTFERNKLNIDLLSQSLEQSKTWVSDNHPLSCVLAQYPKIKLAHSYIVEAKTKKQVQEQSLEVQTQKLQNLKEQAINVEREYLKLNDSHTLIQKTVDDLESKHQQLIDKKTLLDYQQLLKDHHNHKSQVQHLLNSIKVHDSSKLQCNEILGKVDQQKLLRDKLIVEVEQVNSIYQKENKVLEDKQKILNLSLTIDSLTDQRTQLKDDQECPLCGSLDHPYIDDLNYNLNQSQVDFDIQNKHLKEVSQNKTKLETELQLTTKDLDKLQKEACSIVAKFEEHKKTIEPQLNSLSLKVSDLEQDTFLQTITQKSESVQSEIAELEVKITKILSHKNDIDLQRSRLDQSSKLLADKTLIKTQNEKLFTDLQSSIETGQDTLKSLTKSILDDCQDLIKQLQKLNYSYDLDKIDVLIEHLDSEILCLQKHEKNIQSFTSKIELSNKDQKQLQEQISNTTDKVKKLLVNDQHYDFIVEPDGPSYESRIQDGNQHLKILQEKYQELNTQQIELESTLKQLGTNLDKEVKKSIFTDIEDLKKSTLSTVQQGELQDILDEIKSKNSSIETLKNQNIKLYEEHSLKSIDNEDAANTHQNLIDQQITINQQIEELNQSLGKISNIFSEDLNKQSQVKSILLDIQNLKDKYKDWFMMNSLIGSAEGDSFSKFAQGLTLQRLVGIANQHLFKLNPRYQIKRSNDKELDLEIVDLYQAHSVRPTKSLSGGESFLLSLSLALSLSELSSHKNPIRSLFIDEGFGSLDSDTLDVALSALENLRHENRMIGIISHVDALKQRIHAKVEVNRQSNGNSSISVS